MTRSDSPDTLPLPGFDKPVRLLIVVAPTDRGVTDLLLAGARATAALCGAEVEVIEVAGPLDLPTAIGISERMAKFDGYVALGCIVGDETPERATLRQTAAHGIGLLGLQGLCIGNGLVMGLSRQTALAQAAATGPDLGGQAAAAALHLIALCRKWASMPKGIGFRP